MITFEDDSNPGQVAFDLAIVAVGYESRCRWVVEKEDIKSAVSIGLEFGFLTEGSFTENRAFFEDRDFLIFNGLAEDASAKIASAISELAHSENGPSVFIDISSMSREMIANVVLGIESARRDRKIRVTVAYAPSKFSGRYGAAPIRHAEPIKRGMAGWSTRPEQPLGAIFGLGCEPDLALGALQFLEPDKVWLFSPVGTDAKFDEQVKEANRHIEDIFDASFFNYAINDPVITRGRLEALMNAIDGAFRVIVVPFGPKIFAWLAISTIVFTGRSRVGIWAFSSREKATAVDRCAEGTIIWHSMTLASRHRIAEDAAQES